jgi:AraC-like DNA-binding protein
MAAPSYAAAMLRYLGVGPRQFGLHPLKPIVRMNWEFFAVVKGRTAPQARADLSAPLVEQTLWVSAPGSSHTWAGEGARRVHVAVFHFGSVPIALEAIVRERGQLSFPLSATECRRVVALAKQLQPEFAQPSNFSHLVFQGAAIELALLVLRKLPQGRRPLAAGDGERTIEAAIAWYTEHVRANPSITKIAREVHVSASTLRRLFRRVMRESPTRVFRRIQIEKGMRLLTETKSKLDAIADECGFTCTSDFCRAFKAFTRVTPTTWRRTLLTPPLAAKVGRAQPP